MAVLAAQLKDVVDLDSLRADLANAVQKALEPGPKLRLQETQITKCGCRTNAQTGS